MSQLKVAFRQDLTRFKPGDRLEGVAGWQLDAPPKTVEVRLFWFTQGKGTEDIQIVDTLTFDHPRQEEARPFQFNLPPSPYSFSGKLISLVWAVELVAEPGENTARLELTLSPTGQELLLESHPSAVES